MSQKVDKMSFRCYHITDRFSRKIAAALSSEYRLAEGQYYNG